MLEHAPAEVKIALLIRQLRKLLLDGRIAVAVSHKFVLGTKRRGEKNEKVKASEHEVEDVNVKARRK